MESQKLPSKNAPTFKKDIAAEQKKIREALHDQYSSNITHKVQPVTHKTILLLGRSRSGKSTFQRLLIDPTEISDELTIFAGTKEPIFTAYTVDDNSTVLNFIDTPGLFEHQKRDSQEKARDNQTIFSLISQCLNREITRIDLVCFVIPFRELTIEDRQGINELIEFLGEDIYENACLIVTRAESKTPEQCDTFKKELNDYEDLKISKFKQQIHFSGCINRDHWNKASDIVYEEFDTICTYRAQLIELFSRNIQPFQLTQCKISELQNKINENQELKNQIENQTEKTTEFSKSKQEQQQILIEEKKQSNQEITRLEQVLKEEEERNQQEIERLTRLLSTSQQESTGKDLRLSEQIQQSSQEIQRLQQTIQDQTERFTQQIQNSNQTHLQVKQTLEQQIQRLQTENQHLSNQVANLTQSNQTLGATTQCLTTENQRLQAIINKNKNSLLGNWFTS